MTERTKIAWIYLAAAFFLAVSLFLVIEKGVYYFYALPLVLGILLLYVFSLDKVLLLISFLTPLSIEVQNLEAGLGISLPVEPLLIGIMVLFIAKLLHERSYDRAVANHPIAWVIYLILFWMFITTLTSELPVVSIKHLISYLWFVIPAFFVGAMVFKKPNNIHWFVWLYNSALVIVIIYTVAHHAQYGFSDKSAHWVMSPLYNDHTAYGAALAIFLIMTVGYMFYPGLSAIKKTGVLLMVFLLTIAVVLSLSRATWLSIAVALIVLIAVRLRIKFRWMAITFGLFIAIIFTFQHQILDVMEKNKQDSSADIVEHVQSMYNISSDASNLERINRWQAALRLYHERPFFGWGPGTYQFVYGPFQRSKEKTIISTNAGDMGNAHSEYIGPLSEMGMPGMLLVFLLVGTMIYRGLKTYQKARSKEVRVLSLSATLALISYFVHGFLNNFLDTDKLSVPVWGLMAIIVVMDVFYANQETFSEVSQHTDRVEE
ncbi:MAG: O-antigen ligase family protein [Bacteroidales bacterium]|nr:O-antigen ligase family protein [Bacteroidales bacterium]MDY0368393.1 O-antigen ligase family protein [Bacteroidales bacterium]